MGRFSLFRKGLLLVGTPLAFQLAALWLVWSIQARTTEALYWAKHTQDVLLQAQEVFSRLVDAESGLRGYALTRLPDFLEPYTRSIAALPDALKQLEEFVSDNEDQANRVRRLQREFDEWRTWAAPLVDQIKVGQVPTAIQTIQAGAGKDRMDQARKSINGLIAAEGVFDRQRTESLQQLHALFLWLLVVLAVGAFVVAVLLAVFLHRQIVSRIAVLTTNTHRLAEGAPLLARLAGKDEITQLDDAFRIMAGTLKDSQESLERRVQERTRQLADANRDLTLKSQEIETFVYSVSHDLRSPLVNLQGFSQELELTAQDLRQIVDRPEMPADLRLQMIPLLEKDLTSSLGFIRTGVMRLNNIIEALLRLSRAGRVEYCWQQVDLNPIFQRIIASLHGSLAERGAEIVVNPIPPAWGDPTALEQIFANLLDNAVKYLDPSRRGRIEVGHTVIDGKSVYLVADNGLGIRADFLPKMFQAFQRLHPELAPGEGMGLLLVQRMVERHHGSIRVESEAGRGTTLFVFLPAKGESVSGDSRGTP